SSGDGGLAARSQDCPRSIQLPDAASPQVVVRLQVVSVCHRSIKRRSSPMLQGALDTWLWLLFPSGPALVAFAFLAAAKAGGRRSKNRDTTGALPAQVRNVRKIEIQLQS